MAASAFQMASEQTDSKFIEGYVTAARQMKKNKINEFCVCVLR